MQKFTAIIVDDEVKSCETLESIITSFCKNVEILHIVNSVTDAVKAINKSDPDIVFLDIEMPKQNGFELLTHFEEFRFEVIFTTAYDQYAVKAFKFSAVDYLLKPIDLNELKIAIKKVGEKNSLKETKERVAVLQNNLNNSYKRIVLPTAEGHYFIPIKNIIRCEADGNYTVFHLHEEKQKQIIVSKVLKHYVDLFKDYSFCRISRADVINLNYVRKLNKLKRTSVLMSDDAILNISEARKKNFFDQFDLM